MKHNFEYIMNQYVLDNGIRMCCFFLKLDLLFFDQSKNNGLLKLSKTKS